MIGTLLIICLFSAFSLSKVYSITKIKIDKQVEEATKLSLEETLPQAENFKEIEPSTIWIGLDKEGNKVGIVFKVAPRGYGGPIPTIVGLDRKGRITGVKIASAAEGLKETPGLGLRVTEPWFRNQFKGKTQKEVLLKKDGGTIDAITAATISSRAVTQGIREGMEKYLHYLKNSEEDSLLKKLLPAMRFEEVETSKVWLGYDSLNNRIGLVFKIAPQGYSAPIEALVGVDSLGKVTKIKIISCKETEGIGTKITSSEFLSKFKGKGTKDIDKIEAITGATISSKALIEGVKQGLKKYKRYLNENKT